MATSDVGAARREADMPRLKTLFFVLKLTSFGLKLMCKTWRQAIGMFNIVVLFLITVLVIDTAVAVVAVGRIEMLWQPEVLTSLTVATLFYIFFVPLAMYIGYEEWLRKLKRGQDVELILFRAMLRPLAAFISAHVCFTMAVKMVMATVL